MPHQWEAFFDAHARDYDQNPFTFHTEGEISFLLSLYPVPPGSHFLDVGCGTGRHAVELAKRGHRVTGIDISAGMLNVARARAQQAGVEVEFIKADAREFTLDRQFDYAICLCEGGFGLLERGEDPEAHDAE
ncbi:class I SAM-dependent methyltransferase, partial [bacterium]